MSFYFCPGIQKIPLQLGQLVISEAISAGQKSAPNAAIFSTHDSNLIQAAAELVADGTAALDAGRLAGWMAET